MTVLPLATPSLLLPTPTVAAPVVPVSPVFEALAGALTQLGPAPPLTPQFRFRPAEGGAAAILETLDRSAKLLPLRAAPATGSTPVAPGEAISLPDIGPTAPLLPVPVVGAAIVAVNPTGNAAAPSPEDRSEDDCVATGSTPVTWPIPLVALSSAVVAVPSLADETKLHSPKEFGPRAAATIVDTADTVSLPGPIVSPTCGMPPLASAFAIPPGQPDVVTVEHRLDLSRGDAWLDELARDITAAAAGGGRLKFALAPETLGRLDVEVRRGDAGVSVHMAARNEGARDTLNAAQPRLIEEIRAQGVRVAMAEVAADASTFSGDRPGSRARQSLQLPIDVAKPAAIVARSGLRTPVADGRYA